MNKSDFPIFKNNPGLVYLDNAASSQKPKYVIDGVNDFVSKDYANIHRGLYSLSDRSEDLYIRSKELVAEFIGCKSNELIYSYNATYGINLIAQSLVRSKKLGKGDIVLLGIRDHHANILPRQILAEEYGFEIRFINILENFDIDWEDFEKKYSKKVKVVSCGRVSNVTGKIYDVKKLKKKLDQTTFFLVDGSQSVPNMPVNVKDIGCDCLVWTGHKMMAYTGIGIVYIKNEWIKILNPLISGGGAIEDVDVKGYKLQRTLEKFEAGTPNIIGAISLLKALEYIKKIGGIKEIQKQELQLIDYFIKKLSDEGRVTSKKIQIIGPIKSEQRVGVFSFVLPEIKNFNLIGEKFAEKNICVRCGGHCTYPLHKFLKQVGTCRMSLYFYNDEKDIDKFFTILEEIIKMK